MKTERALQINVAVLSVTSALLFSMSQPDMRLAALVMAAVAISFWLVDVTGWFRLNRRVGNLIAAGVFLLVARSMFSTDHIQSIQAIAEMLVYLQIVLLLQRKDRRTYWQLIVLSLLLLVVATVFNQDASFGLLMVVYLFMAISAMALVFLVDEAASHTPDESQPARTAADAARRWPLSGEASFLVGDPGWKPAEGSHPGRDFLRQLLHMGLGTLAFTAVAFFILPRFGQSAWRSPFDRPQHMIGFSGSIELGELGDIIEDPAEVMRIEFTDPATSRMHPITGMVYLHGTVLTRYANRRWSFPYATGYGRLLAIAKDPTEGEIVAQRVTIEPMDRQEVFCVQPFYTVKRTPSLRFDVFRQALLRSVESCSDRLTFGLRTAAFRGGRQKGLVPAIRKPNVKPLLEVPRAQVPTLLARADQWMNEAVLSKGRPMDYARHFERKLRDGDEFHYSLKAQRQDYDIEPMEDFMKNNPNGHCEYFATALALMLRSQGIPARLVVGYKCDEFNPLGKYFQVRQLHAHAWVEAYLAPEQVPLNELEGDERRHAAERGAWLRLDPTPGTDSEQLGAIGQAMSTAARGIDWLQYVWNNYVMEMDRSRQRQAIYRPVVAWIKETWGYLTSADWWKQVGRAILRRMDPRNWKVERWFSWRGGLAAVIVCFVWVGAWRLGRFVVRRLRNWAALRRRRRARIARLNVDFYRRLQVALARRGMHREACQTPREFARVVGGPLAADLRLAALAPLVEWITDAFYRVRFGDHPLDKEDRQAVERALSQLEEALTRP